jgi:1-acyl-sn-glycerol-3-phosphate acyltransferase
LFQAAIDAAVKIQPLALSYETPGGIRATSPGYWGDITFLQSAAAVIRDRAVIARVEFCAPISAFSGTRRELAKQTRTCIAQKLKLATGTQPENDVMVNSQPAPG